MRRIVLSTAIAALLSVGAGFQPAAAQMDNRALYDRIDRLERDLQTLQSNMARGGGPTVIRSPAAGGSSSYAPGGGDAAPALPPGMAARLDDRVDMLEEQLRQLTGKVEEANYRAQQALKQMERMQADIDLRFKDLQAGGGAAPADPAKAELGANSAGSPGAAPGPQVLGSMPEKDLKKALQQPAAAAPAPQPKDPQALYDQAYAAAQRGDYDTAEKGFQDFLSKYGNHALAGNASYWLGDIAYARKDFAAAAATFLEAYKQHGKHTKAPDMIFKAGSAFGQLGKKKEACTAFGILFKEHPNMPDRVKRAATAEKAKYECK